MKNAYKTATITKITQETPRVKTFTLDVSLPAKPGQYIMLWIPRLNEKPFGVLSPSPLTVSIAKVGPATEVIHAFHVGDKITFRGPYGSSFIPKGKRMLLVGGGYGVVPLYFLASSLSAVKRKNITVVLGAKTKTDLLFISRFKKLGCTVNVSTDDGSMGYKGFSTDLAHQLLEKNHFSSVYTCGPEVMMKKIAEMAHEKKIFCQVSVERFFKCGGMGLCGECSLNGHLVCKEGPVFSGSLLT